MNYNMFIPSINKEELSALPTIQFTGNIHLIDNTLSAIKACSLLMNEKFLGFDTETKPNFKKGNLNKVSLLQLSTKNDAYLFRLNKIGLPGMLVDILTNETISKIGIAIRDDVRLLKQLYHFNEKGFIELQDFVKQFGIENSGLSKITGIVLKFRVSKSQQLSNWENETLTEAQHIYAATDAWAALEIYRVLLGEEGRQMTDDGRQNRY